MYRALVVATLLTGLAVAAITFQSPPAQEESGFRQPGIPWYAMKSGDIVVAGGMPVLLVNVPTSMLVGESAALAVSDPWDPESSWLAYSAKSPYLGCSLGVREGLTGLPDPIIMDQCHQGLWHVQDGQPYGGWTRDTALERFTIAASDDPVPVLLIGSPV